MKLLSKITVLKRRTKDDAVVVRQLAPAVIISPADKESCDGYTVESTSASGRPSVSTCRPSFRPSVLEEKCYEGPSMSTPIHWIQECLQNHKYCSELLQSRYRPTRLVDLGPDYDLSKMRLVETTVKDVLVDYLALSYCWGTGMPDCAKTYTSRLSEYKTRLPRSRLPKTFKHLFEIAKRLGVRYVWIDSLCILQDSDPDWQKESALMGKVYSNALCTIAAESARDCRSGIWLETRYKVVDSKTIAQKDMPPRQVITQEDDLKNYLASVDQRFHKSPLQKRAWSVQERNLSPRVLHFTFARVFWECREIRGDCPLMLGGLDLPEGSKAGVLASRQDWQSLRPRLLDAQIKHHNSSLSTGLSKSSEEYIQYLHYVWRSTVEDFSARALTKPTDRLPALSGLATALEPILRTDYLAGIWRSDIASLLWTIADDFSPRCIPSGYEPTWSWASYHNAPISYRWIHGAIDKVNLSTTAQILDSEIVPMGANPKGTCFTGAISLWGRVREVRKGKFDGIPHAFYRDSSGSSQPNIIGSRPVVLIRILSCAGKGTFALLLQQTGTGQEGDEYRRLGMMGEIRDDWFDKGVDMKVKIV